MSHYQKPFKKKPKKSQKVTASREVQLEAMSAALLVLAEAVGSITSKYKWIS